MSEFIKLHFSIVTGSVDLESIKITDTFYEIKRKLGEKKNNTAWYYYKFIYICFGGPYILEDDMTIEEFNSLGNARILNKCSIQVLWKP